jgi:hypothetical protein
MADRYSASDHPVDLATRRIELTRLKTQVPAAPTSIGDLGGLGAGAPDARASSGASSRSERCACGGLRRLGAGEPSPGALVFREPAAWNGLQRNRRRSPGCQSHSALGASGAASQKRDDITACTGEMAHEAPSRGSMYGSEKRRYEMTANTNPCSIRTCPCAPAG